MKKLLGVVAATALAVSAIGAPVLADEGGVPNENACHGVFVSTGQPLVLFDFGNPSEAAKNLGISVKEYQQYLREWEETGLGWFACALLRYSD